MNAKSWLQSSGTKLGTILTIDHPTIVEIARLAGFDWIWIDGEHGRFNESSVAVACAVTAGGPPTFVRLPDRSATAIKRFLDTGCDGIILPQVSSAAEVDEIARAALYPPRGERSVGISRAQGYGARFSEYLQQQDYVIIVQIETVAGVRNAEAIIRHEAVDAVVIGPYDLSGSFGIPGEIDSPQVVEGIAKVQMLCKKGAKPCGIFAASEEKARTYSAAGFDLIAVGMDCSILLGGYNAVRTAIP
ncbi:MAG TPA: aldolase/citrate lyase family protein [Terracidiphilus sp.]|jgi:2-dehydro-3-deoxyglucarate aldolase/4-hydroxy-2-oxoheptanedioate aldolase